jgi:hypothetical protein
LQMVRHHAREDVGGTAGGEGHNHRHLLDG